MVVLLNADIASHRMQGPGSIPGQALVVPQ